MKNVSVWGLIGVLGLLGACVAQVGDLSSPLGPTGLGGSDNGTGGTNDTGGSPNEGGAGGETPGIGGGNTVPDTNSGGSQRLDAGTDPQSAYCQVRAMVTNRCLSCHTNPPTAGAPMPLVTYVDLLVPARTVPSQMVAEVALDRIQNAGRPMPPAPGARVSGAEIQALRDWLAEGTPQRSCGPVTPPPPMMDAGRTVDAGRAVDAGREAAVVANRDAGREVSVPEASTGTTDPFAVASVCTSGVRWTGGNNFNMRPGEPCLNCHGNYSIIGTVYPTGHEPNDCNGVNGGAQVVITDANGTVRTLNVNPVGNFELGGSVATPFRAKVVYQGRERVMNTPQTNGNCNSCHTQNGTGSAPGRIVIP